jgi:hypothetical protein
MVPSRRNRAPGVEGSLALQQPVYSILCCHGVVAASCSRRAPGSGCSIRASVQPGSGAATGTTRTVAGGSRADYRGDEAAVGQDAAAEALRMIGPWLN